jgi:hypothetical protein
MSTVAKSRGAGKVDASVIARRTLPVAEIGQNTNQLCSSKTHHCDASHVCFCFTARQRHDCAGLMPALTAKQAKNAAFCRGNGSFRHAKGCVAAM